MASEDLPRKSLDEIVAMMAQAQVNGRVKRARKTRPVDARPARAGEVVVTVIKGEGKETQSRPANAGDWVVRNRCPESGDGRTLMSADKFIETPIGPARLPAAMAGRSSSRSERTCVLLSSPPRTAPSPSLPHGVSRWWRTPVTPSCRTWKTRRTSTAWQRPPSAVPTRCAEMSHSERRTLRTDLSELPQSRVRLRPSPGRRLEVRLGSSLVGPI